MNACVEQKWYETRRMMRISTTGLRKIVSGLRDLANRHFPEGSIARSETR